MIQRSWKQMLFGGGLLSLLLAFQGLYRFGAPPESPWKSSPPVAPVAAFNTSAQHYGPRARVAGVDVRILFERQLAPGIWAVADAGDGLGENYFLRISGRSAAEWTELHAHRIGFPTELFAAGGEMAYYATRHARIGALSVSRGFDWEVVHWQTPTALTAYKDGVLVGDRTGSISRYELEGGKGWTTRTEMAPLLGLATDAATNRFFAWNGRQRGYWGELATGRIVAENTLPGLPVEAWRADQRWWLRDTDGRTWQCEWEPVAENDSGVVRGIGAGAGILAMLCAVLGQWRGWQPWLRRCWNARIAYLFVLPVFALLLVFEYWPVGAATIYSFYSFSLSGEPEFIGWSNYRMLASDPYFWIGFRNMVIVTAALIGKTLVLPLLVAELVFWLKSERWRQLYRLSFLLPAVVPGLVTVLLWKMIYDPQVGFLNQLFRLVGLEEMARPWLGDAQTALAAVIFTGFPWISIVSFLVLLGGLMNIDQSLFEAAEIDGAGSLKRFWRIDVPLLMPQIKLLTILAVIQGIQEFASILVMTRGGPGLATYVPALHMFLETSEGANLGYASAIGIALFLVVAATTACLNFVFRKAGAA